MTADALDVPAVVRAKARAVGAQRWLDDLPGLVASLAEDWELSVGTPFTDSTEALVLPVARGDGTDAVLKLLVPSPWEPARGEITVLELAAGEGCAALLRSDVDRGALLLERLGPSLHDLAVPIAERHEILVDVAARVWRPAPGCGLPTGADKGRWLVEFVTRTWDDLDRPCAERTVDHALVCAERRIAAHDDERAVLLHGDVHEWNALRADEGFKLVDPDGLLAEPEYDLGVLMREDPVELLAGDPWDLARRTGTDVDAIWEWGVVERVATGLMCEVVDLQPVGRQMLAAADAISVALSRG